MFAELHFTVSAHHDNHDVSTFSDALVQVLRHHHVIETAATSVSAMPKIVFANLNTRIPVADRSLQNMVSYTDIVDGERLRRRRAQLRASKQQELAQTQNAQGNSEQSLGSAAAARVSSAYWRRPSCTSNASRDSRAIRANTTSQLSQQHVQFDYDIRILSEVYCLSEEERSCDGDWRERVMWASHPETESPCTAADLAV